MLFLKISQNSQEITLKDSETVFCCEFCKIFQKIFFTEHPCWAAAGFSTPTIEDFVATLTCSLKFDMNSFKIPLK